MAPAEADLHSGLAPPRRLVDRVISLRPAARYGIAVAAAVGAILLQSVLQPLWAPRYPLIGFFPAIMVSGWFGGFWPGIVTTLLSGLAAEYFWISPGPPTGGNRGDVVALLLFIAIGAVISALNEMWRRGTVKMAQSGQRLRTLQAVTDAARVEAEAVARQLALAIEAGRMGAWEFTIRTGAVKWSPGLEAIHGLAAGTFPGTFEAFSNEIHPHDRDRVLQAIEAAVTERRDHHVQYRIIRADGSVRWVEGRGQLFLDAAHQPDRVIGVCSDITDRKHVEEERAELLVREQLARTEMERASHLKDEFLAVLSHELRTPLNAVLGYAHLLASGTLAADRSDHAIAAIRRNAQAQARLVESLLDLSRVMAGKLELEVEQLDVAKLVETAVDVVRPDADAKEIDLDVDVPAGLSRLVGDGGRLQQALGNVLSNAIKFTPPGGRVHIRVAQQDGHARIQISDTGRGISAEFLPYVFDRFRQADADGLRGRTPAGLGLGLAIVREMVHAHGGTVVAESPGDGKGSSFTLTLPLSTFTATPTADTGFPAHAETPSGSLAPIDILVVDDDSDARDLLGVLLESRGATVRLVSSAAAALAAIARRRPDVLLADVGMPDVDGYSLIRKVRASERQQRAGRLPAIAVTAYATVRDREQAIAEGYDGHVAKPVDPDALARAIAKAAKPQEV